MEKKEKRFFLVSDEVVTDIGLDYQNMQDEQLVCVVERDIIYSLVTRKMNWSSLFNECI